MANEVSLGDVIDQINSKLGELEALELETSEGAARRERITDVLTGMRSTLEEFCDIPEGPQAHFMQML